MRKREGDARLVYDCTLGGRRFTLHDVGTAVWGRGAREVRCAVVMVHTRSLTLSATVRVEAGSLVRDDGLPPAVAADVAALLLRGRRPSAEEVLRA